jgi:hypothetical protein
MIENNRFEVDFFQLEKLIEASWSASTILQFCVLQDLIDIHFYKMSDSQKKAVHSFFATKMTFEKKLYNEDTNEIREKIIARFNPNNQYYIQGTKAPLYLHNGKYWSDSNNHVLQEALSHSIIDGKKVISNKTPTNL